MESKENTSKGINPKVLPIFLVFMVMGFGDVAGPLAGIVKEDLQISNFLSQLIPFSGYILFGLLSIPLGLMQDRKGKKYILVLGLSVAFLGLLLPTFGVYPVDIKDIESFIQGLKKSLDVLDEVESEEKQGIQAQLAKAISKLREKKLDKTEPVPTALGDVSKQDLKRILLNQLANLNNTLKSFDSSVSPSKEKFKIIQEIANIREKIDKL